MDAFVPASSSPEHAYATAAPPPPASGKACTQCQNPIQSVYHMTHTNVICPGCRIRLEGGGTGGEEPVTRFFRAGLYGAGAALAGSLVYWAVLAATDRNFALLAILVGFCVGQAVHAGSRGRGGWAYQAMAVVLTYLSIVTSFTPLIAQGMRQEMGGQGGILLYPIAFLFAIPSPFLVITESPLTVLIIGFGLYQAWKQTRKPDLNLSGPYYVDRPAPASVAGAPAMG